MSEREEAVIAEQRESTYRFLAGLCLAPPAGTLIDAIKDGSILSAFEEAGDNKGFAELAGFVKNARALADIQEELAADHAALFVLPSGVLPHEAVYLDAQKRLGGLITMSVRQFYEKAGADILDNCIEMPDHLGLEMEFMGFVCGIEKVLREKGDSEGLARCIEFQRAFLEGHLLKWVFECCNEILEKAQYGFYRAAACWMTEFMEGERKYITSLHSDLCMKGEGLCEAAI